MAELSLKQKYLYSIARVVRAAFVEASTSNGDLPEPDAEHRNLMERVDRFIMDPQPAPACCEEALFAGIVLALTTDFGG
jgi:hypothetical protein